MGYVFRIIVKCPDSAVYDRHSTVTKKTLPSSVPGLSQVCPESVPSDLFLQLLDMTREPTSLGTLMKIFGQTNRTRFRKAVLRPLLDSGILAMTIPDKPSSSKQKYRITAKGVALLESNRAIRY